MDKKKLKEKLHQYIDNLEDETALQLLHKAAVEFEMAGKKDVADKATPQPVKPLEESVKPTDEGDAILHDETAKRIAAWAFKLD